MIFRSFNPATDELIGEYSYASDKGIDDALNKLFEAWQSIRQMTIIERMEALNKCASSLKSKQNEIAKLISQEMGKPISESQAEVVKSLDCIEYFLAKAPIYLESREEASHYTQSFVLRESMGPILAIMPWNFPLWQVIRVLIPNYIIGNPILLKHSDLTPKVAVEIENIFSEHSDSKKMYIRNCHFSHRFTERVIKDPRIRGVTFTGSTFGGSAVAELAGKYLKKSVLELGGSDAYIALDGHQLDKTIETMMRARLVNNGQSCVAAKRFFFAEKYKDQVRSLMQLECQKYPSGDPMVQATVRGPLANLRFKEHLNEQLRLLIADGGRIIAGSNDEDSQAWQSKGNFQPVQVLELPIDNARILDLELFGPAATVQFYGSEADLIRAVNDSQYGLGAAIFAQDESWAVAFAKNIECGMIAINDQLKSGPALPFGGVKKSGYGKELGREGFLEFSNLKTVGIRR